MQILKRFYRRARSFWHCHVTLRFLPRLFFLFPIQKNKVVFINFNGKGFGCNPKYIALEILHQKLPWDLVWLVNDSKEALPEGIRKARFQRVSGLYEIATAKVIVVNVKNDLCLVKKKQQYVIQTWHGSYTSKLLEKEVEDKLSPAYVRQSKHNSLQTDLFLSNSAAMSHCIWEAFWYTGEILECGYPRNDMLFASSPLIVERIKAALGVNSGAKLVLYAPTFRDDGSVEAYNLDCMAVLGKLREMGGEWKLLTRLHPNAASAQVLFPKDKNIINVTHYPDMQELLLVSDILITDYSSTPFEFAAMGKQVYIYASDVEQYQAMRGLKSDFFTMPYSVCTTNKELLEQITNFTPENARQQAEAFMSCFGGVDRGDASNAVVERMKQLISQ